MTAIRELVKAYAAKKRDIERYDDMGMDSLIDDAEAESERIMAQIESYYVPRPEGSVTMTRAEHDALMAVYNAAYDMLIHSAGDESLAESVNAYTEMIAEGK